jgi:hypothetical protein
MPAFNKRHYELVAKVLRGTKPQYDFDDDKLNAQMDQWERTCLALLNHFRADNPQFQADKFLAACKGEKTNGLR